MKIIATVTLFGDDRVAIPPGEKIDLPAADARSLVERGLAVFPPSIKNEGKSNDDEGHAGNGKNSGAGSDSDGGDILDGGGN